MPCCRTALRVAWRRSSTWDLEFLPSTDSARSTYLLQSERPWTYRHVLGVFGSINSMIVEHRLIRYPVELSIVLSLEHMMSETDLYHSASYSNQCARERRSTFMDGTAGGELMLPRLTEARLLELRAARSSAPSCPPDATTNTHKSDHSA